jgi:thioredoxin reductase (NADPH)
VAASGAVLRKLDVPGESELQGKGVSHCADCDGALYRTQDVIVIGGGDSALQEALVLSSFCRTVKIVVRSRLRARRKYIEMAKGAANISFVWDSVVENIVGGKGVEGVALRNVKSGAVTEHACTGVFPFIGVVPQTAYLPASVRRDPDGCIVTDARFRTSLPAIYAVGAVRSEYGGQLVNAAAEGVAAIGDIASALAAPAGGPARNHAKV